MTVWKGAYWSGATRQSKKTTECLPNSPFAGVPAAMRPRERRAGEPESRGAPVAGKTQAGPRAEIPQFPVAALVHEHQTDENHAATTAKMLDMKRRSAPGLARPFRTWMSGRFRQAVENKRLVISLPGHFVRSGR
jgi:hypothetical protein